MKPLYISLSLLLLISCSRQPVYTVPAIEGTDIVIDAGTLEPDIPRFYTYHYRNKNINFFVIKTNGKILSFLDACANCYPAKLGYRYDNGYIICKQCSVRYSVSEVEKGFGSCFPIRISGHLKGSKYLIPVSVLQRESDKF
ncbi:MAG: Fe-S-containing protein [Thermodesulfovibrionales bacterium]|nr:Fe-S-containing protein [Thermodesulfovibrionales bacterium]